MMIAMVGRVCACWTENLIKVKYMFPENQNMEAPKCGFSSMLSPLPCQYYWVASRFAGS